MGYDYTEHPEYIYIPISGNVCDISTISKGDIPSIEYVRSDLYRILEEKITDLEDRLDDLEDYED